MRGVPRRGGGSLPQYGFAEMQRKKQCGTAILPPGLRPSPLINAGGERTLHFYSLIFIYHTMHRDQSQRKGPPLREARVGLAAAVVIAAAAAVLLGAAADAALVAAAAEQDEQDDDPQTVVAAEAVVVIHRITSRI